MARTALVAVLLVAMIAGCSDEAGMNSSAAPLVAASPSGSPTASPVPTATPSPTPTPVATSTPVPTATPIPTLPPTPPPTAKPTPKPTPVAYTRLTNREWAKVVKAPDRYIGDTYQVWACITQFDAATGFDSFRGEAANKKLTYWYSDGTNALFTGDEDDLEDFVEEDVVVMNVFVLGSYTYETTMGGSMTVPSFLVMKITRKGSC